MKGIPDLEMYLKKYVYQNVNFCTTSLTTAKNNALHLHKGYCTGLKLRQSTVKIRRML